MEDRLVSFLNYLENEKKMKLNTLTSYKRDLRAFSDYITKLDKSYDVIDGEEIKGYLYTLKQNGRSASTVSRNLASIKSFYKFLRLNGIKKDPTADIKYEVTEKKEPSILSSNEINRLLKQPDTTTLKGLRDKAMIEVLYATGIRVSELVALELDDIDLKGGYLRCGEIDKERIIPLHNEALLALSEFLNERKKIKSQIIDKNYLFVNYQGKNISRQGFWKIIKDYSIKAKIKQEITPHTLRHSFAVHLLQNGADLKSIQEMLGHSYISTTKMYSKYKKCKHADVYNKSHPKAK